MTVPGGGGGLHRTPSLQDDASDVSIRLTRIGCLLLLAALFVPRARAQSYEDFFGEYFGADGPPSGIDQLPAVNSWFFPVSSAVTLAAAVCALSIAQAVALRPDRIANQEDACWALGLLLPCWTIGSTVVFPSLDGPPFTVLAGAYLCSAASLIAAAGLLGIAREARAAHPASPPPGGAKAPR